MLTSVEFKVVARLGAEEIEIMAANIVLSSEFVSGESPVTENGPQLLLGPSGLLPQGASEGSGIHHGFI